MGMKERGGRIVTQVIPDVRKPTLRDVVLENVETGAVVSTDELMSYGLLTGDGFVHGAVKHGQKEWSYYDYRTGETHSTNNIDSFWKLFKYSVRSTHIHLSREKLSLYLAEFCYRSNHREIGNLMFDACWRGFNASTYNAIKAVSRSSFIIMRLGLGYEFL